MVVNLAFWIFVDPDKTFKTIEKRSSWSALGAQLIVIAATAALLVIYYNWVNIEWLLSVMTEGMERAQRESLSKMMTKDVMLGLGVTGSFVTFPLFTALYSLYFFLVGKVRDMPHSFAQWFAMVSWASLPAILILPIGIVGMATAPSGQLSPEEINAVSLNQLFFHLPLGNPWKTMLESISLVSLWSLILMALGYKVWAGVTFERALLVAIVPNLIVYGAWTAIVLMAAAS